VTDGQGAKVIDTRRANALKGALMADLADDEVMRALPRRSGLSRARASVAR
jgi:hypothetical protein